MPRLPLQVPPGGKQATQGPISRVPCPHCLKPMDFRPLAGEDMGGAGWGSQGLEAGSVVTCDVCERKSKILAIEQITVMRLVPV